MCCRKKSRAARRKDTIEERFRALLAGGADPCVALDCGGTLLHLAASNRCEELVTLLLSSQVGMILRQCLALAGLQPTVDKDACSVCADTTQSTCTAL